MPIMKKMERAGRQIGLEKLMLVIAGIGVAFMSDE